MKEKKRGTGRIVDLDAEEEMVGNALGDQMAAQAMPGVFSAGKQIVATKVYENERGVVEFLFNDDTRMRITGEGLKVDYLTQNQALLGEDLIDGVVTDEQDGDTTTKMLGG